MQDETSSALRELPVDSFEAVSSHSLGLIERSCEYLEQHLGHSGGDAETMRTLDDMRAACAWLDRSLSDMTALLRCRQGTAKHVSRPFDMCALLQRLEKHAGAVKAELGITLKIDLSECKEPGTGIVYADAEWAEKICLHLVSNALHACDSGGHITLKLVPEKNSLCLYVDDDGCGLPDGTLEAGLLNHRHFLSGAHCGLLLCRSYCRLMGWALELTPRARRGTRAILKMPCGAHAELELHSHDELERQADALRLCRFFDGELEILKCTRP